MSAGREIQRPRRRKPAESSTSVTVVVHDQFMACSPSSDSVAGSANPPGRSGGQIRPPSPGTAFSRLDDTWNAGKPSELPLKRADRNFAELLQELRVAQTGVQILFAFLLGLAFTDRFAKLGTTERDIYIATLAASALTGALFVARVCRPPAVPARVQTRTGPDRAPVRNRRAVRAAHRDRGRATAGARSVLRWLRRHNHRCGARRDLRLAVGRTRVVAKTPPPPGASSRTAISGGHGGSDCHKRQSGGAAPAARNMDMR